MSVITHIEVMRQLTHDSQEYADLKDSLLKQDEVLFNQIKKLEKERADLRVDLARANEAPAAALTKREVAQHNLYKLWAAENKSAPK